MQDSPQSSVPSMTTDFPTRKVQWYDKEKASYDTFFAQKLKDIRMSEEQASMRNGDRKEAKKRKKVAEKRLAEDSFLEFASLRHPDHPAYAISILQQLKDQNQKKKNHETSGEMHDFNSPTPKPRNTENNKENIRE
jgi:hypothetical protein